VGARDVEAWVEAALATLAELTEQALGLEEPLAPGVVEDRAPLETRVACIALTAGDAAVQLGLVTSPGHARFVARALLGLGEDDPDPEPEEVNDALGEAVNIMAGSLKSKMAASCPGLTLGLPMLIDGAMMFPSAAFRRVGAFTAGPLEGELLVVVSNAAADLAAADLAAA